MSGAVPQFPYNAKRHGWEKISVFFYCILTDRINSFVRANYRISNSSD
jgi:hypothetical protein